MHSRSPFRLMISGVGPGSTTERERRFSSNGRPTAVASQGVEPVSEIEGSRPGMMPRPARGDACERGPAPRQSHGALGRPLRSDQCCERRLFRVADLWIAGGYAQTRSDSVANRYSQETHPDDSRIQPMNLGARKRRKGSWARNRRRTREGSIGRRRLCFIQKIGEGAPGTQQG
jgi:hypothetical protein